MPNFRNCLRHIHENEALFYPLNISKRIVLLFYILTTILNAMCSFTSFNFKFEPISATAPAALKNEARLKSGQNRLDNNYDLNLRNSVYEASV
jgi:hypothetical protein